MSEKTVRSVYTDTRNIKIVEKRSKKTKKSFNYYGDLAFQWLVKQIQKGKI